MTGQRVLSVDIGTSAVKAAIFDERGTRHASATEAQRFVGPASGAREHDPRRTWAAFRAVVTAVVRDSGATGLSALAITGPRGTFGFVDRGGRPLSNFVTWQDQRGASVIGVMSQRISEARYERLTGMGYLVTSVLPKLLWAQVHDRQLVQNADAITTPQGYILRRLGVAGNVAEPSVAAHTGLLELRPRSWSQEIRAKFGVDALGLPELVGTNELVGTTSAAARRSLGIPTGTPVVLAASDGICAEIGLGVIRPNQVYAYLGTASAVAGPLPVSHRRYKLSQNGLIRMPGRGRAWDRVLGLGGAGGSAADWAAEALGMSAVEELDGLAGGAAPGARGVLFVPTLAGASSPSPAPKARGSFLGLSLSHGRADLARAVLEGIALEMRCMLELASLVGLAPTEVRLCGGGARSEVWRQVISDVFQLPLLSTPDPDAGLRGAAISGLSAAAAISVEDLAALWSKDLVATNPVSSVADRYDALSANYRLARQSLLDQGVDGALFDTMARLSQD